MSNGALITLHIEHLRGSVTPFSLSFEKSKKLSIVYGENGTGKSTVCDALDLIGNGDVGSLNGRGLGRTDRYWHSIGRMPSDVRVTLTTASGACVASLGKKDVVITPIENRPRVEVLRRSQILGLVEAKPAERYEAISRFIDVAGIEASEGSLRKLINDISRTAEVAVARVAENKDTIQRFWEQAGRPGLDAVDWASLEVTKDQSILDERKDALNSLKDAFKKLVDYPAQYSALTTQLQSAQEAQRTAQAACDALTVDTASEYLEVLEILRAAQRYFHSHPDPEVCPLCESSENAKKVVASVKERIDSQGLVDRLEESKRIVSIRSSAVLQNSQRLEDLERRAAADAASFEACCVDEALAADTSKPPLPSPADLSQWKDWLADHAIHVQKWSAEVDACTDSKKFGNTLRASLDVLDSNGQAQVELDVILPRLKECLRTAEEERRGFTDCVLGEIASEVGRLYEVVHPGEGLNSISLELDPAKRASLEIGTDVFGLAGAPPQAYFSDSHLDTLGLCVFLALAERESPAETILVLDDVLGSVDEPHVDRLIEMLYSEALKFRHCVITTHYRPWKQKLRWGWLQNGQCQFIELTRWTLSKGISLIKSVPDVERLRSLLAETPPDPQLICAKAGVILEALLDFLTLLYECQVPRRVDGLYTLGDLLPAVNSKLRAALRVEHREVDASGAVTYVERKLAPHLEELARIAQARNVFGCHFSALSFDLLDSDAIAFASEVLCLMDAVVDHDSGWPRNGKSGSYWATSGDTRRLHPLKKPS